MLLWRSGPQLKSSISPHTDSETTIILGMGLSSALKDAIRRSAVDEVEASLLKHPVATRQDDLDTCLELAMPHGSLKMIKRLLQLGADFEPLTISNVLTFFQYRCPLRKIASLAARARRRRESQVGETVSGILFGMHHAVIRRSQAS
jgi:hypothetical protein